MEFDLLKNIIIIFAFSIVIITVFQKLKIPSVIGFIVAGILTGPYCFGFINDQEKVHILSEMGVILILFTIGIEFSIKKFIKMKRQIIYGGLLQIILTTLITTIILLFLGYQINKAIFFGFLIALSSTAIVLKILQSKGLIGSPQGKISLAILICQDLFIIPLVLILPFLAGINNNITYSIFEFTYKILLVFLIIFVSYKFIVPKVFNKIVRTRIKELFLLTNFLLCFIIVFIFHEIGISLALGAFISGLVISDEFSHEAMGIVTPFRDVFASFFFVSIGMLLDIRFLVDNLFLMLIITFSIIIIKILATYLSVYILKYPVRISLITSFILAQIGEFSFVMLIEGRNYNLLDSYLYQVFLSVAILTLIISPFMIEKSSKLALIFLKKKNGINIEEIEFKNENKCKYKDHLIIIGYGLNGRNLAKAASVSNIPYLIIEMNHETVSNEREKGEPIIYGDSSSDEILLHAGIKNARVCVIAISDNEVIKSIIINIKRINPTIHLIVRTRYISDLEELITLGANDVIPEEFETSVEIFTRVLALYLIPKSIIEKFVNEIRSESYEMLRSLNNTAIKFTDFNKHIKEYKILNIKLSENSILINKNINDTKLRNKYRLTLLAIIRNNEVLPNPSADFIIKKDDNLVLFGKITDFSNTDLF